MRKRGWRTLEQDLQREMGTLSREVREAVAELRQGAPQLGARQPWSLDNVVRLHNELRAEGRLQPPAGRGILALAEAIDVRIGRRPATGPGTAPRTRSLRRRSTASPSGHVGFWLVAGGRASSRVVRVYMQDQVRTGLTEAAARADSG